MNIPCERTTIDGRLADKDGEFELQLYPIRSRHRRTLLFWGGGQRIWRFICYDADLHARQPRVAKEREESYKTIGALIQKDSKSLCSLFFTDSNLLIQLSLEEVPRGGAFGHGIGPSLHDGNTSKSVTP